MARLGSISRKIDTTVLWGYSTSILIGTGRRGKKRNRKCTDKEKIKDDAEAINIIRSEASC